MHTDTIESEAPLLPRPSQILLTVKQQADQQPGLTEGSICWDLFNREKNGLEASGAIVTRGRKLLIISETYMEWLRHRKGTT